MILFMLPFVVLAQLSGASEQIPSPAPLRMERITIGEQKAVLTLRNAGTKTVTAWAVEVLELSGDGESRPSVFVFDTEMSMDSDGVTAIAPHETRSIEVCIRPGRKPTARVIAVIFGDGESAGTPEAVEALRRTREFAPTYRAAMSRYRNLDRERLAESIRQAKQRVIELERRIGH
jgi:hypothetical protein